MIKYKKQLKFKMADSRHVGKCWKCYNTSTDGPIGTNIGWSHPTNANASVLVVTANRTVNVLVLCGVEIKSSHNFDETWMTVLLWYKNINW